ncbi:serine/threonine-protein kinase [Actinotalea sp. AC32]|nr:serine/threonine-protein kinase [Actinotalea sp. AC32]
MRPETGTALGGRYRLVSRVAVGGMGEVWVAHDDALKRDVAVKVLREEFAGDTGFLERFRAEARNSAQLSHPNIAALYDYGEQAGSGFLVMELVLGEPMSDLLDRQPVLPTRRLLPILAQTARALHAAHVAGVVHRDVKPGNILLARSGRVKITDFGISTAINQVPMTASGMVMGTAQYLSPEQAIGKAATPASDIYSLGIVAYEALVGHRPFTGPTAVDIAVAHVNTPVPPMPGAIDPELSALVMRMLAKEPEARPRSAASLARHLDDLAETTPSDGVPLPYGRHARPVDVAHAGETGEPTPTRTTPVVGASVRAGRSTGPGVGAGVGAGAAQETSAPSAPTGGGPVPGPAPSAGSGASAADAVVAGQVVPPVIPPVVPAPHPSPSGESRVVPVGEVLPPPPAARVPAEPTPVYDAVAAAAGLGPTGDGATTGDRGATGPGRDDARRPGVDRSQLVRARPRRDRRAGGPRTHDTLGADRSTDPRGPVSRFGPALRIGPVVVPRIAVALALLVLFALLGAAFADSLWGPSGASDGAAGGPGARHVTVVTSAADMSVDGMIQERPAPQGHDDSEG